MEDTRQVLAMGTLSGGSNSSTTTKPNRSVSAGGAVAFFGLLVVILLSSPQHAARAFSSSAPFSVRTTRTAFGSTVVVPQIGNVDRTRDVRSYDRAASSSASAALFMSSDGDGDGDGDGNTKNKEKVKVPSGRKELTYDEETGRFFESNEKECDPLDEYCVLDKDSGKYIRLTVEEKERIFLDSLQVR